MFVFEGIDCSGKTTAINYVKEQLVNKGKNVVVLDDWAADPELKYKLLTLDDPEEQVKIVLEARNKTKPILEESKNSIILYDRYDLSTLVYQVLRWEKIRQARPSYDPNLLKKVLDSSDPYTLVYITPTEEFDRTKFLNKRSKKDKFDELDPYFKKKSYWYIMYFSKSLGIELPEHYTIRNDGTNKFFEQLDRLVDVINTSVN